MKLETIKNVSVTACAIITAIGSIQVLVRNEQREKRNKTLREMPDPLPKDLINKYRAYSPN